MRKCPVIGMMIVTTLMIGVNAYPDDWETDFEQAQATARKTGKYLLVDFSGSDWCGWCMKLEKEVFSQGAFQDFARQNLVCVSLDFPKRKKQSEELKRQNDQLAQKYQIRGFPTVIILDPQGNLVVRTGYRKGGAEKYVEYLRGIIAQHQAGPAKK